MMEPIYIPHIAQRRDRTWVIPLLEQFPELETLTPVKGEVRVVHQGNYLQVSGQIETIVTLMCDRCLQQYNYRLSLEPSELIWLDEAAVGQLDWEIPGDEELDPEAVAEALSPYGHFQPHQWVYEQVCLALPVQKLCQQDCPGIPVEIEEPSPLTDQRWASLVSLKQLLQ